VNKDTITVDDTHASPTVEVEMSLTRDQEIQAQKLARKIKSARKAGLEPEETSIILPLNRKKTQNNGPKNKKKKNVRDSSASSKSLKAQVTKKKRGKAPPKKKSSSTSIVNTPARYRSSDWSTVK